MPNFLGTSAEFCVCMYSIHQLPKPFPNGVLACSPCEWGEVVLIASQETVEVHLLLSTLPRSRVLKWSRRLFYLRILETKRMEKVHHCYWWIEIECTSLQNNEKITWLWAYIQSKKSTWFWFLITIWKLKITSKSIINNIQSKKSTLIWFLVTN